MSKRYAYLLPLLAIPIIISCPKPQSEYDKFNEAVSLELMGTIPFKDGKEVNGKAVFKRTDRNDRWALIEAGTETIKTVDRTITTNTLIITLTDENPLASPTKYNSKLSFLDGVLSVVKMGVTSNGGYYTGPATIYNNKPTATNDDRAWAQKVSNFYKFKKQKKVDPRP